MEIERYAYLKGEKLIHRIEARLSRCEYDAYEGLFRKPFVTKNDWRLITLQVAGFQIEMDGLKSLRLEFSDHFDNGAKAYLVCYCDKAEEEAAEESVEGAVELYPNLFLSSTNSDLIPTDQGSDICPEIEMTMLSSGACKTFALDFGSDGVRKIMEQTMLGDWLYRNAWKLFKDECPGAYADIIRGDVFEIAFMASDM